MWQLQTIPTLTVTLNASQAAAPAAEGVISCIIVDVFVVFFIIVVLSRLLLSSLQLHELFEDVGDEAPPPPGQDVSAEQWLRSKGATPLQLEVADVCYANDFGCSLQQLGLREMITENNRSVVNVC
jgi:hypothetical protein